MRLKFARDRHRYMRWVFEAKKRFGLCVLDYMVTSNHVHLLVKDTGGDVLAQSMQLIGGRTAQEYNQRKNRHGAFLEDRYHATAIEANEEHLHRRDWWPLRLPLRILQTSRRSSLNFQLRRPTKIPVKGTPSTPREVIARELERRQQPFERDS
jgi:REP element-mobilizing transposase RayT